LGISLKLDKGWRIELGLDGQMSQERNNNMDYGVVSNGPQQMNISIRAAGQRASHILSRGQKKILSVLFYLCSAEIIYEQTGIAPILCLDDIGAELDADNQHLLLEYLQKRPHQLFITAVTEEEIAQAFQELQVFHVKQ